MLLERIFSSRQAADRVMDGHFREFHSGQANRKRIGDMVYRVLRHRDVLTAEFTHCFPGEEPRMDHLAAMASVAMAREAGMIIPAWPQSLPGPASNEEPFDVNRLSPWQRYSLPQWIWESLERHLGSGEVSTLASVLNEPATVDLRVNSRKMTRDAALAGLQSLGLVVQPTPFSPDGLRLQGRASLATLTPYRQGMVEIQDEGSQLISHLVAPQPGMMVVDFCAGSGGKTLHLAAMMGDRGRVWAIDTDSKRLHRLAPRGKRAGIKSIRTLVVRHEGDRALKKLQGCAHRVLVDAPCSAIGTLRRNPEVKWRLTPAEIETFHLRQSAILQAAARLVAPRGRLVYATCSLMTRENEDVAHGFLSENRAFHLLSCTTILSMAALQGLLPSSPFFTLLPHRTRTDGFFAAIFERKS